tara:strand:+ start:298 stop:477 length:180 start_codon:yes stop_codon:yes gene_type:complete
MTILVGNYYFIYVALGSTLTNLSLVVAQFAKMAYFQPSVKDQSFALPKCWYAEKFYAII